MKKSETRGSTITTTIYIGNLYEQTLVNSVVTEITKYYYAGGKRVAMRRNANLSYIFGDHLGSTSVVSPILPRKDDQIERKPATISESQ